MALRKKHAVQGGDAGRYVKVEKKKGTLLKSFRTQKQIWFLCLLALIWVVIFCYIPMAGNIVAFLDWYPGMSLSQSKFVGLENFMTHMPNQMSGGQQQRVGIARALAMNQQIIFADEPTGNLDSKTTMEVLKLMQKVVREQKQTLVMVTHDNNLATYADRIFKIIDGKIVSIEENHHEVDLVQLEESMQAAAEAQAEGKSQNPAAEEQIETVVEAEEHRIEGKSE